MRVPTIDLFAGAGGLSIAARRAGCDVRLHVDLDSWSCETLRANAHHHDGVVLQADIAALSGNEVRALARVSRAEPLLIIGGPPCQPFSKAAFWSEDGDDAAYRRARANGAEAPKPKQHGHRPDERRFLVDDFMRIVVESRAHGFVFENVSSLLAPRNRKMFTSLLDAAHAAGFSTTQVRANAADFGVPQKRQRVFVLGSRCDEVFAPLPTHTVVPDPETGRKPTPVCGEVLAPYAGDDFFEPEEVIEGRWADHLRAVPPGWNYKHHTAWGGHPRPTFVTETRFWNFLLKLSPDLPSWTIPAGPGPWTGPFHWESRRLRTPELAALQGFPEGYVFVGNRRERVRQIGNAAPPPLGEPMIRAVAETLVAWRSRRRPLRCAA
jgi:DNA (cytosine-5)-methyltransferase 1